ncbi:hypothetical protein N8911_00745 [bacterium]|jgi:hypothetical protein|nr:hypothetical protein [bacterium]
MKNLMKKATLGSIIIAASLLASCGGTSSNNSSRQPVDYCAYCGSGIYEGQTIDKMGSLQFCSGSVKDCLTRYRLEN